MISLIKKELKDYYLSPVSYIVVAAFVIVLSAVFFNDLFIENQANMRKVFELIPLVFIIIIPALTMRTWAEERKEGTLELLMTQPISIRQLIGAKYFSTVIFASFMVLLTLPIPITLNYLGNPDNGVILAGYIGTFLLISAYAGIGQVVSMNSKNQIAALIIAVLLIGLLYIVGEVFILELLPFKFRDYFSALGLGYHFRSISKGVIDSRDVLYYFSIIGLSKLYMYKSLLRIKKRGT